VGAFAWSLPASLSLASPVSARGDQHVPIDVPAGSLAQALTVLARQGSISIGGAEPLAQERAAAIHGNMPVRKALDRLLRDTSLRAVQVAPTVFRLEQRPRPPRARPAPLAPAAGGDIVVTATKQGAALRNVAQPLSLLNPDDIAALGDSIDTAEFASGITGLSVTNLGPGRDRLFIRGVADSPFDGFGQASVSVQVDDARATYDAPDPDLRLIDLAQVELLKGPQGPLYGSGALGGVFRLVPAKPALDHAEGWAQLGMEAVDHGGLAGSAEVVANVPLTADRIGVRAVAYRIGQSGWIDDSGGSGNVNHGSTTGGRIAIRARIGATWTVDLSGLTQLSSVADSQYVTGSRTLQRPAQIAEPQDTDFSLLDLATTGQIGSLRFTSSTSLARQTLQATYDASQAAALLGASAPARYFDDRHYQVFNSEARIGSASGRLSWVAGISLLNATTDAAGTITDASGARGILQFKRRITEVAAYGEASFRLNETLRATAGGRLFRSVIDDERREQGTTAGVARATVRVSPSATLSWQPVNRLIMFARYASASRPGGVESTGQGTSATYQADEIQSYDIGLRWSAPRHALGLDADVFHSSWQHVQADYLDTNGLITTRNAGDATNSGIDMSLTWSPARFWTIGLGGLLQHARLDVAASTGLPDDTRLPVVPDLAGHLEVARTFDARGWHFRLGARATYTGDARLSFDPGLDRKTDEVAVVATSLTAERAGWHWRVGVANLLDSHADSFAFGNPFSVQAGDQRTPVKPRTLSLSLRRSW
jgi:outer membrane receptor protein involved in Fe transport